VNDFCIVSGITQSTTCTVCFLYIYDNFRQLLQDPRCGASKVLAVNNVPSFTAVSRKLIYSFMF